MHRVKITAIRSHARYSWCSGLYHYLSGVQCGCAKIWQQRQQDSARNSLVIVVIVLRVLGVWMYAHVKYAHVKYTHAHAPCEIKQPRQSMGVSITGVCGEYIYIRTHTNTLHTCACNYQAKSSTTRSMGVSRTAVCGESIYIRTQTNTLHTCACNYPAKSSSYAKQGS